MKFEDMTLEKSKSKVFCMGNNMLNLILIMFLSNCKIKLIFFNLFLGESPPPFLMHTNPVNKYYYSD